MTVEEMQNIDTTMSSGMLRPTWVETWMEIVKVISRRSYDPRLKVGALVVTDDNTCVLGVGFNGNAHGLPNRPESLEPGKSGFLHAEVNCLIKCDYHVSCKKIMYVTHNPCPACAKLIINANITRVVYGDFYRDTSGLDILRSAGVQVCTLDDAILIERNEKATR